MFESITSGRCFFDLFSFLPPAMKLLSNSQYVLSLSFSLCLFLSSCQSQNFFGNDNEGMAAFTAQVATVFVEGKDRGTTPQTLRIYRGRKELSIALKQGRKTVRTFTLEETYSPNAGEIDFSFRGSSEAGTLRFTVEELPTQDKLNYVIPFYEQVFTVEDNQYGLTLIIAD